MSLVIKACHELLAQETKMVLALAIYYIIGPFQQDFLYVCSKGFKGRLGFTSH